MRAQVSCARLSPVRRVLSVPPRFRTLPPVLAGMADKIGVNIPGGDTTARSVKKYFTYT
jgi:hypothetical protein